jgi:mono/diheme cytochrome c family protein
MRGMLLAMAALLIAPAARADLDGYVQVSQGRYLAIVGDCAACHGGPSGAFAGGRAIETPFGNINSANITPDRDTGIGRWSAEDFYQALHSGHSVTDGRLYPAFPYNYYTRVTRADSDAIFAYLRSLDPVLNPVNRDTLPFPFDIRTSMAGWNMLEFEPGEFKPDPKRSAEYNRGAYLVEGLGHCGACHTPMDVIGGPKDDRHLQGNVIQAWTAPDLTDDKRTGLGAWSVEDVVAYLKTGRNDRAAASGPMGEVVEVSTSHMTDGDLRAIAVYLKERGAAASQAVTPVSASDSRMTSGQALYVDHCAACHVRDGTGVEQLFPRLAGAQTVQQADPTSVVRVIIAGARSAATDAAPTGPAMPSFGWTLSDAQVADLATYIRNAWGNAAPAVSAGDVAGVRGKVAAPGK